MMKQNSNIKFAVAQFDNLEDGELKELAKKLSQNNVHWYLFDQTADREFELRQLNEHYDVVYLCKNIHNFMEVKNDNEENL